MMEDLQIVTPREKEELKLDTALQLLAVFVRRYGGEVVITQREFDMVEGLPVMASQITPEHLRIRIANEDELYGDLPPEYYPE